MPKAKEMALPSAGIVDGPAKTIQIVPLMSVTSKRHTKRSSLANRRKVLEKEEEEVLPKEAMPAPRRKVQPKERIPLGKTVQLAPLQLQAIQKAQGSASSTMTVANAAWEAHASTLTLALSLLMVSSAVRTT